jgi:DNA-binding MarR family transcriptional regulator/GNAT superfamily N-acetyltransferase
MDEAVSTVRRFNRFFTKFVGALDADFLHTGMSLAEARILFEIAQREPCLARDIKNTLDLDAAFVSRVVRRFEARGWIERVRQEVDSRRQTIVLTKGGRHQFETLDARQRSEVESILRRLSGTHRRRLIAALGGVQDLLQARETPEFTLRPFQPGDMGLIASGQSVLYREVYGWNASIEVNVGEVAAAFLRDFKPGREQCWVAEVDGTIAGSVFLTDEGGGLSRLRLLYVEPEFQGRGIGDALVAACVEFARSVGYSRITLWTHSILESARRIYTRQGFRLTESSTHNTFGPNLMGEIWELKLHESNPR